MLLLSINKLRRWTVAIMSTILLLPNVVHAQLTTNTGDLLPNKRVNTIQEDKRGFIWMGTGRGLCRFNGVNYRNYFYEPNNVHSLPSDFINYLFLDRQHRLWVCTGRGLCRYEESTDNFVRYPMNNGAEPQTLLGLVELKDGNLFAYGADGIMRVNDETKLLEPTELAHGRVVSVMVADAKDNLFIGYNDWSRITLVSSKLQIIDSFSLGQNTDVKCMMLIGGKLLLAGTERGITAVDFSKGKLLQVSSSTAYPEVTLPVNDMTTVGSHLLICTETNGILDFDWDTHAFCNYEYTQFLNNPALHVSCSYADSHHNIWLGTFNQGYFVAPKTGITPDYVFNDYIRNKFVTRICPDAADNLWIGMRYDGLCHYNVRTHAIRHYTTSNLPELKSVGSNFVESMMIDSHQQLWIGIGKQLVRMSVAANGQLGRSAIFRPNTAIVTIAEASDGTIWTGSSSDGIVLFSPSGEMRKLSIPHRKWLNVTCILPLHSGQMLYSSYGEGLFVVQPKTLAISSFVSDSTFLAQTSYAICLYETTDNKVWIGTYGYGVTCYDMRTHEYQVFNMKDGLPSNDVLAITADKEGQLWVSTSFGIARYDASSKKFSTIYKLDGPDGRQFHEKCVGRQRSGEILFGGNHGITYFNPKQVSDPSADLHIVLENLFVHNVNQTGNEGVLSKPLDDTDYIDLQYNQNAFSLDFVAIDYAMASRINYACRLDGIDNDWVSLGALGRLTYTNLPAGTYQLAIRSRIGNGEWSKNVRRLTIHVQTSPWLSWPAFLGYALLIGAFLFMLFQAYQRNYTSQRRMKLMQQQREHERELNDTKMRFFSNISHELRTPLSMIYGPIKMLDRQVTSAENRYLTRIVKNNVERLLCLIDQLLDLGKMETDALKLQVQEEHVRQIIQLLVDNYSFYAQEKGISLSFQLPTDDVVAAIDADKLNKVTGNLLSNALKYTPSGGHVSVEAVLETEMADSRFNKVNKGRAYLVVSVTDDGVGVPADKLPHLFERYRRFEGKNGHIDIAGTGIGLNYTKRLVELHHGEIVAIPQPKGMQFAFALPADLESYLSAEIVTHDADNVIKLESVTADSKESAAFNGQDKCSQIPVTCKHVLVVEDNAELAQFIRRLLSPVYAVSIAANGVEGLEQTRQLMPDLIISDVIMPKMDGFEMCGRIKQDVSLCHIPVVLLTARTQPQDQMAGYTQGADAYLSKPFAPDVLMLFVENMFNNMRLRSQYVASHYVPYASPVNDEEDTDSGEQMNLNGFDNIKLSPMDRKFMVELTNYIEKHILDNMLNVNQIANDLCVGRTVFYQKVKALTDQTPNDFIQNYRFRKAKQLLDTRAHSVKEIAYLVGFSSPSHFSSRFKRLYGISPRDYLLALNKKDSDV